MRVLLDTDVLLDLLRNREPFSLDAALVLSKAEGGEISGYMCATAVTTIHYLASKVLGAKQARAEVRKLLSSLDVAPINRGVLSAALDAPFADFEDAVVHESAVQVDAEAIVTRNIKHFQKSTVPVFAPRDLLGALNPPDSSP